MKTYIKNMAIAVTIIVLSQAILFVTLTNIDIGFKNRSSKKAQIEENFQSIYGKKAHIKAFTMVPNHKGQLSNEYALTVDGSELVFYGKLNDSKDPLCATDKYDTYMTYNLNKKIEDILQTKLEMDTENIVIEAYARPAFDDPEIIYSRLRNGDDFETIILNHPELLTVKMMAYIITEPSAKSDIKNFKPLYDLIQEFDKLEFGKSHYSIEFLGQNIKKDSITYVSGDPYRKFSRYNYQLLGGVDKNDILDEELPITLETLYTNIQWRY